MTTTVTLQHDSVNSGTAIVLENTTVKFSWKNLNEVKPILGKYDIVENEYGGFENPKLTLSGFIDVDNIPSNGLTQELTTELATLRSVTPLVLTVTTGTSATALKGRPTGGYETDGDMTLANTINVVIDSFDLSISAKNADLAHFWDFSIQLHEVI